MLKWYLRENGTIWQGEPGNANCQTVRQMHVSHFPEVHTALFFYRRPAFIPISANWKKPEDFCFYKKKRWKAKVTSCIAFAVRWALMEAARIPAARVVLPSSFPRTNTQHLAVKLRRMTGVLLLHFMSFQLRKVFIGPLCFLIMGKIFILKSLPVQWKALEQTLPFKLVLCLSWPLCDKPVPSRKVWPQLTLEGRAEGVRAGRYQWGIALKACQQVLPRRGIWEVHFWICHRQGMGKEREGISINFW